MRNLLWLAVLAVLAACSGPTSRHPLSAREHYAEARSHELAAAADERAASAEERASPIDRYCGELASSTPYGATPRPLVPCWTSHHAARDTHLRHADDLRRDAREHRTIATELLENERVACAKLAPGERHDSPSWHRDDIVAIEPIRDGGPVLGARLVFRKLDGLTADWLRDAYACHQAAAAVEGYDPTFMSYCPAGLEGVTIEVAERTDGIAVSFRSARTDIGAAILARVEDLKPER